MKKILEFIMDNYVSFNDKQFPYVVKDYTDNIWFLVIKNRNRRHRICDGIGYRVFYFNEVKYSYCTMCRYFKWV